MEMDNGESIWLEKKYENAFTSYPTANICLIVLRLHKNVIALAAH